MGRISRALIIVVLAISFGVSSASAYPVAWNPDPAFPDYWQRDPGVLEGSWACAPTAATNSLYWLADRYNLSNLKKAEWQDVANTLGDASHMKTWQYNTTFSGYFLDGMWQYIVESGYGSVVRQESRLAFACDSSPTVDWIKNQVSARQDVEILLGWVKDNPVGPDTWVGGHYVSVTGYDLNSFFISDPWNNNSSNLDLMALFVDPVSLTFSFDEYGNFVSEYTKNYLRVNLSEPFISAPYDYIIVGGAVSQSIVPVPAPLLLFASGIVGILAVRRKRPAGRA